MSKTIEAWLRELPRGHREQAMMALKSPGRRNNPQCHVDSLNDAIDQAFWWDETPQKGQYWSQMFQWTSNPTNSKLPKIPAKCKPSVNGS